MKQAALHKAVMSSYPNLSTEAVEIITRFFQSVDTDGDGFVTVDEIKSAEAVDVDGNGTITQAEIDACAAPWLSAETLQDYNGDSKLSLQELLKFNNDHV